MATKGKTRQSKTTRKKPGKSSVRNTAVKDKGHVAVSISDASNPVSQEERRRLIAEAAYKRAEARAFQAADPVTDWLDAEREIDQKLESGARI